MPDPPWWRDFYDLTYARLALEDGPIEDTCRFLRRALALSPGDRVLEQCCGVGRFTRGLAAGGALEIIAFDQSEAYIERARELSSSLDPTPRFVVADAFRYTPPDGPVDAAFNWATSFGYCRDDARNLEMLERAFEALRSGGRFALDYHNLPATLRGFQGAFVEHRPDGTLITRESRLDLVGGMLEARWTFVAPDGARQTRRGDTRLYMPHDLAQMLRAVGFESVELFGDVTGAPLTLDSPRCIALARKP